MGTPKPRRRIFSWTLFILLIIGGLASGNVAIQVVSALFLVLTPLGMYARWRATYGHSTPITSRPQPQYWTPQATPRPKAPAHPNARYWTPPNPKR